MALTKLPGGSIVDGSITSAKIAGTTILGEDIGIGAISADKINTTLDISSHTITLPQDLIGHRELNITFTSPADDDKFLQISSAGVLQWAAPGTYPITYAALSGVIPAGHIADETVTSAMIENLTIADGNIADGTITAVKLNTTLDLSTKTITYPTDNSLTNLTITGDLHITGTTTEVDTQNLLVKDNIIVINDEESGVGVTAGAAGIEIHRGPGQDKATIMWNETSDKFEFKIGAQDAVLVFDNVDPPTSSVGYDQVKINNLTDPGPGVNTFLESDGTGNFNLTQIQIAGITLDGAVTGPVDDNTLANYSVTADHLQDFCITSAKIDTTLSFVGKTIILNPGDILTAINGAGSFNVSNPNFTVPDNCIDSAKILDGSVTGYKLADTLNLVSKTIQWPSLQTFDDVVIEDTLIVENSTVLNNVLTVTDKVTITNGGLNDALIVNNSSSANIMKLQNSSTDVFVVDNSGDVTVKQNLFIEKNILERKGTTVINGNTLTIDLATGSHFEVELDGLTQNIEYFLINNTNSTANTISSFYMKVIQGTVDRTFIWSGMANIKWPTNFGDGSLSGIDPPIITSGNNKEDLFKFTSYDNGSTWYASIIGMDFLSSAPIASTSYGQTIHTIGYAIVQSTAIGTAYLVNTTVSPLFLESHITGAADDQWNSVAITTADTNTNLPATGLADGTYKVYAVNAAGTISIASINSVTVDTTGPIASVTTATITTSGNAVVQSTETGTAYLVHTNVTVVSQASITNSASNEWNSVPIILANTNTNLAAAGLIDGTYKVYAVDAVGNLSSASSNSVTVDMTEPTVSVTTATISNSGFAVVQSTETGTAYLVNTAITVSDLASITGSADNQWNSVAISSANTNTNLMATGLADGTYKVYATDALDNLSIASTGTITIGPMAATGGTATTYGNYKVHTFTSSGAFQPDRAGTIDVLVVAGGGGGTGGSDWGGGGGAGGVVVCSNKAVTAQQYTVTIGAGGTGSTYTPPNGNGVDSTFIDIVAKGGGGGGGAANGADGGSGGGCPSNSYVPYRGEATQLSLGSQGGGTGYGNPGGGATSGTGHSSSGSGGGAGSKGYAAFLDGPNYTGGPWNEQASPGGIGIQNLFQTGSNQYYGGGGASKGTLPLGMPQTPESGGLGGGGDSDTNGTANTGGGGGGGASTTGGSGIVVIRYLYQ